MREITAPNNIVVNTNRIRRYTLFLNQDLVDFSKPVVKKPMERSHLKAWLSPRMETLLQEARHRLDVRVVFPGNLSSTCRLPVMTVGKNGVCGGFDG